MGVWPTSALFISIRAPAGTDEMFTFCFGEILGEPNKPQPLNRPAKISPAPMTNAFRRISMCEKLDLTKAVIDDSISSAPNHLTDIFR